MPPPPVTLRRLIQRGFTVAGASLTPERLEALFHDFLDYYGDHLTDNSYLFPGVVAALDRLEAAGLRLAVCTNKPIAATRALLDALGLAPHFALVLGGDSLAVKKPDPGHVLGILAGLGVAADEAVMIGDHQNDIRAARGAGVRSVFAAWGYGGGAGADLSAADPSALPALLG